MVQDERDNRRSEATSELQIRLDTYMNANYPLIGENSSEALTRYRERQVPFATFRQHLSPGFFHLIADAITFAKQPDDPAFGNRADEGTFREATDILIEAARARTLHAYVEPHSIEIGTTRGTEKVKSHRLVIEAEPRERAIFRPAPHLFALELKDASEEQKKPQEFKTKKLRLAAQLYGIPFTIMAAIYSGMQHFEIVNLFNNPDVQRNIIKSRMTQGVTNPKLPPNKQTPEFSQLFWTIRNNIMRETPSGAKPNYSPDGFIESLGAFDRQYRADFTPTLRAFFEVDDIVQPRAVFAGADEIAHIVAPDNFLDPYRSEYISERFGKLATTQMMTAYLEFALAPNRTNFPEVFGSK